MSNERGEPRADNALDPGTSGRSAFQGSGLGNPDPTSEFDRFELGVKPYVAGDMYRAFRG